MATAPFFGDPAANAHVWGKYAVLLGSLTATKPTASTHAGPADFTLNDPTVPTTNQWDPVGALDADTPFDEGAESSDSSDHTAAGFGVYATTVTNQKQTRSFTMKETTATTLGIIYDASGLSTTSGVTSGDLAIRDSSKQYLAAFYRETAGGEMERYVTKNYATINSVSRNFGNNEATVTVELLIVPDANGKYWEYLKGPKA
jgi:hypothetical protein